MIFGHSGSTALKPDIILSWKSLHGPRNTSRNNCLCIWFTVPSTNEEAKWKTVLWTDKLKFEILFWNHGHQILRSKVQMDHQYSVQMPSSLMAGWYLSAFVSGYLHIWKYTINTETYTGFIATYTLGQMVSFSVIAFHHNQLNFIYIAPKYNKCHLKAL